MISPPQVVRERLDHRGYIRFKSAPVVSRNLCPPKTNTPRDRFLVSCEGSQNQGLRRIV